MPERPRQPSKPARLLARILPYVLGYASFSSVASARRDGIAASSCNGCHGSSAATELSVTTSPTELSPGDDIAFTVTLTRAGSKVGGIYIAEPPVGQLRALDSELKLVTGGLVHASSKAAGSGGQVSFRFGWRAPSTPGAVQFEIAAVSGDGDGRSSGDASAVDVFSFTYGCAPQTLYPDHDRDGYGGSVVRPSVGCEGAPPPGYSTRDDDCDDAYDKVHPDAMEVCNDRDDDCDGAIDEGAPPVELWPDDDGDGFYGSRIGTPITGCLPLSGYAADPGDCAPRDPARFPGAVEVCNLLDDNCDGRVDERLHPQCGVGFCRRESPTCDAEACRPGSPLPEECNLLDDDCNGLVDDGALCGAGKSCVEGGCVDAGTGGGGSAASAGSTSVAGSAAGGSGGPAGSASGGSTRGGSTGAGGSVSGGAPNAPASGHGGTPTAEAPESGGCAVRAAGGSRLAPALALAAFGAAVLRRRRAQRGTVGGIGT